MRKNQFDNMMRPNPNQNSGEAINRIDKTLEQSWKKHIRGGNRLDALEATYTNQQVNTLINKVTPVEWVYADETARISAGGFIATDIHKYAYQTDNATTWMLLNTTPTWVAIETGRGDDIANFFNGTFRESFNALVTSNGSTIVMTLEKAGSGDLTMQFSDGLTTLPTTPALTIALTEGTIPEPQENFIYIPHDTKILTKGLSGWPTIEHIRIGYFFVQTPTYVQGDGALINQNWNDHLTSTVDEQGHLAHMGNRIRKDGSIYLDGLDGDGDDDYTTSSAGSVTIQITSGIALQMHEHIIAPTDTSGTDNMHIINAHSTDGGAYYETQNLYDITVDASGNSLNNKFFNIVLWEVVNKTGEYSPVMVNIPTGRYNNAKDAQGDVDGYDIYSIPRQFSRESSTGFLVARLTFRKVGGTWVYQSTVDLRGTTPSIVTGGNTGAITEFSDNQFAIFDNLDITKQMVFHADDISTATIRTITLPDADGILITSNNGSDLVHSGFSGLLGGDYHLTESEQSGLTTGIIADNLHTHSYSGASITDHGALTGLDDTPDHSGYVMVDGTRDFTGGVEIVAPAATHIKMTRDTDPSQWSTVGGGAGATFFTTRLDGSYGGYVFRSDNATTPVDIVTFNGDGSILIPAVYTDTLGATNKPLGIDSTGKLAPIGFNGSFTGTLTGCTTSPTGTFYYSIANNVVTLSIPRLTGTSNTTSCTITGISAEATPSVESQAIVSIINNSLIIVNRINIREVGVGLIELIGGASGFVTSGLKGINATTVQYRL